MSVTILVPTSGGGFETGIGRYCAQVLTAYERMGVLVSTKWLRHHLFTLGRREVGYYLKFLAYYVKFHLSPVSPDTGAIVHTFNPMIVPPETSVVTVWDLIPFDPALRRVQQRPPLYAALCALVERSLLEYPDAYVAISETVRDEMRRYFRLPTGKIRIARPSVDLDHFRPIANPDAPFTSDKVNILHVGTAVERKNIMGIVEAIGELDPERFRLVRVGPPTDSKCVEGYTRRGKEIGVDILELGYASDEKLPAFYTAADLFVFPSFAEGAGIPPLESMACGTNVVVSDLPVHREMCGRAAFYTGTEPGSIADAIDRALSNPIPSDRLRSHAASWTWDDVARVYLDLYRDLGHIG